MAVKVQTPPSIRYRYCFCGGRSVRNKLVAVQSILEMAENRAKQRQVPGHSPSSQAPR